MVVTVQMPNFEECRDFSVGNETEASATIDEIGDLVSVAVGPRLLLCASSTLVSKCSVLNSSAT